MNGSGWVTDDIIIILIIHYEISLLLRTALGPVERWREGVETWSISRWSTLCESLEFSVLHPFSMLQFRCVCASFSVKNHRRKPKIYDSQGAWGHDDRQGFPVLQRWLTAEMNWRYWMLPVGVRILGPKLNRLNFIANSIIHFFCRKRIHCIFHSSLSNISTPKHLQVVGML